MGIVSAQSTMYPHLKEPRQMTTRLLQAQKKRYCSSSTFGSRELYGSAHSRHRFYLIVSRTGFEARIPVARESSKFMILFRARQYVSWRGLQYANVMFFSRFQGFQGMQPRRIVLRGREDFRVESHLLGIVLLGYLVEYL